jgi:hypothetical protein
VSAEIKAYPGVSMPETPRHEQPVEQVVSVLEELLAEAREGKIRAIACAVVKAGEATTHVWANGTGRTAHEQSAAIHDLAFAYDMRRYEASHET